MYICHNLFAQVLHCMKFVSKYHVAKAKKVLFKIFILAKMINSFLKHTTAENI